MRKWIPAVLILAAVIASIVVYPQLPERMPTHWSASGDVNGWSNRLWGAWIVPLIMAVVWVVMKAIPHVDPRRANYEKFAGMYDALVILILLFMLVMLVMPVQVLVLYPGVLVLMIMPFCHVQPYSESHKSGCDQ